MTRFLIDRKNFISSDSSLNHLIKLLCCFILFYIMGGCSSRDKPAEVVGLYSVTPLKDRVKNTIHTSQYTVKKGETLYSIAWRANSDVRQLATLNNISPPYKIYPGQKIFLVAKKSTKSSKVPTDKTLHKKSTKDSKTSNKESSKKILASTKKQAYGKNVGVNETVHKALPKAAFSTKIKQWKWPVNGKVIEHFSNRLQGNKGINIAGRKGTKIRAAASGKVVYAGDALRGYGKLVIIKHNEDYLSAYAHNDQILVKEQQLIKLGDVLAKMGNTDAPRVMLHFEVRFRGKSVNPLKYLPKK